MISFIDVNFNMHITEIILIKNKLNILLQIVFWDNLSFLSDNAFYILDYY